ncbi:MAG: bifunctional nuclease family protein [candidate division WOR-3 bacterium]
MNFIFTFFILTKLIEVEVFDLIPQREGGYTLVLKEINSNSLLLISIGESEGISILRELNKMESRRPLTYELVNNIIEKLGAKIEKVTIDKFENETYFATIHLKQGKRKILIDARPSDAINLAIRKKAKIYVEEKVFEKMKIELKEEKKEKRI